MKWIEDYATGSPEVDAQHKALFETSDDFRSVLENSVGERTYDVFLDFLKVYAETHFAFEENCMMAHQCPVAARNKQEHAGFNNLIQKEIDRLNSDGFSRERAFALLDMIDRWLESHICRIDVQLRSVLPGQA